MVKSRVFLSIVFEGLPDIPVGHESELFKIKTPIVLIIAQF